MNATRNVAIAAMLEGNHIVTASIERIGPNRLPDYASVPIAYEVNSILVVEEIEGGIGGLRLREQPVPVPQTKDYDACDDGGPLNWPRLFDISPWGLWIARERGDVVGAAAVAWNTPGFQMLEDRSDLAVLWDIRVRTTSRLRGVGTALFREATRWAKSKCCELLKIETQNVNAGACRFYAKMGCFLGGIDRLAYGRCPDVAREVMLMWFLDLSD